jgi:hypothetical protein
MNIDYVFGPIQCTDDVLNANIQFLRVKDTQERVRGWAWSSDEDNLDGECSGGGYDADPIVVVDDLLRTLREELVENIEQWYEAHPKAQAALDKHRQEVRA